MTFGLRNAAQTFQRLIDTALRGLEFCYPYIDDILIASSSHEEHTKHLRMVFDRLRKYGLSINYSKCVLGVDQINFLGYRISELGTQPLEDRVSAIRNYPKPTNLQELRKFLGTINFYRRFIKNAAHAQAPLHAILAGAKKRDKTKINWTKELENSFETTKQQLVDTSLLAHPRANTALALSTDASDFAMGATLEQFVNNNWQPLGFYSKKLTPAQCKYSTYDRELLAIYSALKFFRHLVEGQELLIKTDHKPLIYAFQQKSDKATPRQSRHLNFIAQFSTRIIHIAGKENLVPDSLSRIQTIDMPVIVTTQELSQAQLDDEELEELLRSNSSSLDLRKLRFSDCDATLYCDISDKDVRPYIPRQLRRKIFDTVHNLAHPSGKTTRKLIGQRFVWPSMRKDITEWARTCLTCQRSKIHRHTINTPQKIAVPDERFKHVHLDIVGPLPLSRNFKYCLTIIDRYTRWPEAIPILDISADTVAQVFLSAWVARFGTPATITTDRGTQFESQLFSALAKLIGAKKIHTTAYHPASNGIIERWHRTLKAAIMCQTTQHWVDVLPLVLLGLRTSIKEDINASAAELVYGTPLSLPGEFFTDIKSNEPRLFLENLRQSMRQIRSTPTSHHDRTKPFVHKSLPSCSHVFIRVDSRRKPLEPPYEGPFEVIERPTDKVFLVDINGRPTSISTERLRPAFFEKPPPSIISDVTDQNAITSPTFIQHPPKKRIRFAV